MEDDNNVLKKFIVLFMIKLVFYFLMFFEDFIEIGFILILIF